MEHEASKLYGIPIRVSRAIPRGQIIPWEARFPYPKDWDNMSTEDKIAWAARNCSMLILNPEDVYEIFGERVKYVQ